MIVRQAVLALGSNLGDRGEILQGGVDAIAGIDGVRAVAVSPVYETVPAGGPPQPDYLNAVLLVATSLPSRELLDRLHEVEAAFDRVRVVRWGPRTLDIDIITVDGEHSYPPGGQPSGMGGSRPPSPLAPVPLPDARPMAKTATVSGAHPAPPAGTPPVPPGVRAGGPDRKDRERIRAARADEDDPELTLPHPRAHERAFVLVPWHDIDPEADLPGHGSVAELLVGLDTAGIRRSEVALVIREAGS